MGGFLAEYDAIERLTFGERWWVDVARYLSAKDTAAADRALMPSNAFRTDVKAQHTEAEGLIDNAAYQFEIAVRAIRGWNLTDHNDQPLPLEPEAARRASVEQLPDVVFKAIVAAVAIPGRDEAEQKSVGALDPGSDLRGEP